MVLLTPSCQCSSLRVLQVAPLLRRGRLVLAVDLDHTLLSSARFAELDVATEALLVHLIFFIRYPSLQQRHSPSFVIIFCYSNLTLLSTLGTGRGA